MNFKLLYNKWIVFGETLGKYNSYILLSILYFVLVLPLGTLMRLFKGDFLNVSLDKGLLSYRINRGKVFKREDFERPF